MEVIPIIRSREPTKWTRPNQINLNKAFDNRIRSQQTKGKSTMTEKDRQQCSPVQCDSGKFDSQKSASDNLENSDIRLGNGRKCLVRPGEPVFSKNDMGKAHFPAIRRASANSGRNLTSDSVINGGIQLENARNCSVRAGT
ncbi:hypothetical protein HAX54_038592 [Datura stramonium]|uniref:Uncharacterized protein n=1 Tax=Datura stramonium TaxID=4076 RepID=A0ABS8SIH9_DATST|nr:hypothetical protein [Datura stramonium]